MATERQPEAWLDAVERDGHGLIENAALTPAEEADELLLMGLRLAEGIDLRRLAAIGGVRPAASAIERLEGLGLIGRPAQDQLIATRAGRFVLNELVLQLAASFEPATEKKTPQPV